MPESINIFTNGMSQDTSPLFQPKNSYVDAINIEFLSDALQGSVAISNSKGNKLQNSIPNVGNIFKLIIKANGTSNITINGITSATAFTVTTGTSYSDLYNFILNDSNFNLTNITLYYNDTKLVLVPTPSNPLTVTVSNAAVLGGGGTPFIPAQTNLQPIGYSIINDDIYIFTTNCKDTDPQLHGGGYGQLWKLSYDNINFNPALSVITLIYSANLNFTTYYNIPQTGVVARYENGGIQRIYFTDFYNNVRSINVKDPQLFALDVNLLDLIPAANFDISILSEIQPGGTAQMKVGAYQMAYRYKSTGGAVTNFSVPSNIVSVTTRIEGISVIGGPDNFADYCGDAPGTNTNKLIAWTVNNLDDNYDEIECVVLIRESNLDPPSIYSFNTTSLNGRSSVTVSLDGDILNSTNTTPLSLNEFLLLSGYFTHAKTLSTKDNRLIAGNLKTASLDIDYDARAFRNKTINNNTHIYLTNNGVQTQYTLAQAEALDVTEDTINDYNNANACYYKPGTAILGGAGANVSYEFISVAVESDTGFGGNTVATLDIGPNQIYPFRTTGHDTAPFTLELNLNTDSVNSLGIDVLQQYPLALPQVTYEDMKYPQYNGMFWSYQQEEIYRMALQFFDKAGNPYFAKWIGDIKFPNINDICPAANSFYLDGTQTGQTTYVKSFTALRAGKPFAAYITQLGIKFTVNIPAALTEKISGYSIVRVKREESDKSVIAEGIITSVGDFIGSEYFTPDPSAFGNGFMNNYSGAAEPKLCYFNTPNFLLSGITEPRIGDVLNVRKAFQWTNTGGYHTKLGGSGDDYYIYKLYDEITENNLSITLDQVLNLGIGQDGIANNGFPVNNNDNVQASVGNRCYFFGLGNSALNNYAGADFKLYANVTRALINQYGGPTYQNRASSKYIVCDHFRPVRTNPNGYTDSPQVFGGDTMNYHIDLQRAIKDWNQTVSHAKISTTFIFPVGMCGNIGMRYGTFVNRSLQNDNGTGASGTETYDYNDVYSCQNDIVNYYPKPDPFIETIEYNNRFRISEIKINGELSDSWRVFKENNYWDVEGTYGPITSSLVMADKFYFWQNRAFGLLEINPRAVVQDLSGTALQIGTGLPIQRHDYISTVIGSRHQGSTISSDRKLYWFDVNTKKIYTFDTQSLEPFSDVKGMYSYLYNNLKGEIQNIDKPLYIDSIKGINGVSATYDYKRHKAIFTFNSAINNGTSPIQTSFTLAINEINNTFLGFYSFTPRIYINDYKFIISSNPTSNITLKDLYIHDEGNYGTYYGTIYNSYIKFIMNEGQEYKKIFDNLVWDSQAKNGVININNDTWKTIRITNDYQNTDVIPLVYNTNIKRKERSWQLAVPRNRVLYSTNNSPNIYTDLSVGPKPFGERIRDKYASIELTYDNASNHQLLTNNIITQFRLSSR